MLGQIFTSGIDSGPKEVVLVMLVMRTEVYTGKWVLKVCRDADDFYNKNAFSILDNYINSDNDVIYFFANSLDVNTLLPTPREKGSAKYL